MKQVLCFIFMSLILTPVMVVAETIDMLDYQINELTHRRDALRAELDACKQNTKKFKVAGIATLGATGLGVLGNIALHNKIQNMGEGIGSGVGGAIAVDTRSEAQKIDDECAMFCADDAEFATDMGCEC